MEILIKQFDHIVTYKGDDLLVHGAGAGELPLVKHAIKRYTISSMALNAALRFASDTGHLEVVKYLVQQGADIHDDGERALNWATREGHLNVVKYLVENGTR